MMEKRVVNYRVRGFRVRIHWDALPSIVFVVFNFKAVSPSNVFDRVTRHVPRVTSVCGKTHFVGIRGIQRLLRVPSQRN